MFDPTINVPNCSFGSTFTRSPVIGRSTRHPFFAERSTGFEVAVRMPAPVPVVELVSVCATTVAPRVLIVLFGLNTMLRLLYLFGAVPTSLESPWLRPERKRDPPHSQHIPIDPDFDDQAQAAIEKVLLEFKYWHDEPLRAVPASGWCRESHPSFRR